jgi:competence protein ComEC
MNQNLNQSVFLRLTLFYIAGIIIQTHVDLYPLWIWTGILAVAVIAVSFLPSVIRSYQWRWLFGAGTFLLSFSWAGIMSRNQWTATEWQGSTEERVYRVQILDEAVRKPKTLMFRVGVGEQKAIIYLQTDSAAETLQPSDRLIITARFEKTEQMFLRKNGIAARAFVRKHQWEKAGHDKQFNLRFAALKCRRFLLDRLRETVDGEKTFAVGAALLLGYTLHLDKDIRQTFASAGAAHVLAISGLHFSIIYGILYFLFSFLGNRRKERILRQVIILPMMWFFVYLTGMGASVIRAAVMISLWGIGNAFSYKSLSVDTAGAAAFFMLLYNPLNLYDVGFQLSFSAVMAILLITPYLSKLYQSQNPVFRYVWGLSCVSISAQLGTAPLSMYYFHQFPLLFLAGNLFAVPMTTVILCLMPLTLLLRLLPTESGWLMWPLNQSLKWFVGGLEAMEKIPGQLIDNIVLSEFDAACLACQTVFFLLGVIQKRASYLYMLIIFIVFQVICHFCGH